MTLKDVSLNLTEKEYHALPVLSQSALGTYDREGYSAVATLFDPISSPSLTYGSMVDCLMTRSEEDFNNEFVVANIQSVSEAVQAIINNLAMTHKEKQLCLVPEEDIVAATIEVGWYKNLKPATRVAKIYDQGSAYYDFIKAHPDQEYVSQQDVDDAKKAVELLKTHVNTAKYFSDNPFNNTEVLYQLQFKEEDNGIPFKGMLDLVVIDHKNKRVYPCDLKTTKSIYTFEESFYKWRYYIQAAMYTDLLAKAMNKVPELAEYAIMPYRFIVIDRNVFLPVVFVWNVTDDVVDAYGQKRKDYHTLLKELSWILEHKDTKLTPDWYSQMNQNKVITMKNYAK